jgi:uncharacterized protein (DUF1786 family)
VVTPPDLVGRQCPYRLGHAVIWEEATQQILIIGGTDITNHQVHGDEGRGFLIVDVVDFSLPATTGH